MPKIVRFEHPDNGFGPYHSGFLPPEVNDRLFDEHSDEEHPGMGVVIAEQGHKGHGYCGWFAACETLEDLEWWFDGFVDEIIESGHGIVEYDVPVDACLFHDWGQVLFQKDLAVRIEP